MGLGVLADDLRFTDPTIIFPDPSVDNQLLRTGLSSLDCTSR